ncbi:hypothetical protein G4B88_005377 [Cannabis sativa]|uniref:Uncharacterized protein n=1 Tax=Cannabis sativa TaxID=3483 RepID=A0A7J6HCP6_CANSA|nr:hypothetical protein G4B88_005377 [Cannabis sativa]
MECSETIFSAPSTCHRVKSHLLGSLPLLSLVVFDSLLHRINSYQIKIDTQGLLIANDSKEEARNPQEGEEAEYSNILCKMRFGGATKKK